MTTYTLTGLAVYTEEFTDDFIAADATGAVLEFVVEDSVTSLSYTIAPPAPGFPVGEALIDLDNYNIRLNGMTFGDSVVLDGTLISTVSWSQGSTTLMDMLLFGLDHPVLGRVDGEFVFTFAGVPLPQITDQQSYDAAATLFSGFSTPLGMFAPGIPILLSSLGATVSQNDRITGTDLADTYEGGVGRDHISGGLGDDTLFGGRGTDTLIGGRGADRLDGGGGRDTADYSTATFAVTADLLRETNNSGDAAGDIFSRIENLTGSDHADVLNGNGADNDLAGGRGNDRIDARRGDDMLHGGQGEDLLIGRIGDDRLLGGGGRDTLAGGGGDDVMTGGNARDTFIFNAGTDVITDFDGDRLRISDALWSGTLSKAQVLDLASVVNGDTVFDFGGGHTLTLEGYTDIAGLNPLLTIF